MARRLALLTISLCVGCGRERDSLPEEQARERGELAREQTEEQRDLAREQSEEQREQAEEHAGQAPEPAPATSELAATLLQHQAVSQLAAFACRGVAPERADACPIDGDKVSDVDDVDGGVRLRLAPQAAVELGDLQRHVGCYAARVASRAAGARLSSLPQASTPEPQAPAAEAPPAAADPVACAIDMTGIRVEVLRPAEQIEIRILTNSTQLPELRRRVQRLVVDRRSALR